MIGSRSQMVKKTFVPWRITLILRTTSANCVEMSNSPMEKMKEGTNESDIEYPSLEEIHLGMTMEGHMDEYLQHCFVLALRKMVSSGDMTTSIQGMIRERNIAPSEEYITKSIIKWFEEVGEKNRKSIMF